MVLFCSASLPITLTNTRACFRSGVTRTSVTVTRPSMRGSFSSPATMIAQFVADFLRHTLVPMPCYRHFCFTG